MTQPEPYTYTDPSGDALIVGFVRMVSKEGRPIDSVAFSAINGPDDATAYVPLADVDGVVAAIRTAAGQDQQDADTEQRDLRVRAEQAEDLLRVAEQTANTSEAKRARAVRHAEIADAVTAETKRLLEHRTTTLRTRAERAEADASRLRAELAQARSAALTAAERQFLTFALDQAAEEMSLNDGFTEDDEAALSTLRRMAAEAQHTPAEETTS